MRFSIRHLLLAYVIVAGGVAIWVAIREQTSLTIPQEQHLKWSGRLQPMIDSVDAFVNVNSRCPNFDEFKRISEPEGHGFLFKADSKYVQSMGGKNDTDYILGTWAGEWHYCYCSWNQKYYRDRENLLFGD